MNTNKHELLLKEEVYQIVGCVNWPKLKPTPNNVTDKASNADRDILSLCDHSGAWSHPYAADGYSDQVR